MKNLSLLLLLIVFIPFAGEAQKKCNCEASKIEDWNKKDKGKNESLNSNGKFFQHPVTTFYRWGNKTWFSEDDDQQTNLTSLRSMLHTAFNADYKIDGIEYHKFRAVYEDIWDQAQNTNHLYYDPSETGGHNDYTAAITARACGFVLIANFDKDGDPLEIPLGARLLPSD